MENEYSLLELFNFEEGIKFITNDDSRIEVKIEGGYLVRKIITSIGCCWDECFICKEWINTKFKINKSL